MSSRFIELSLFPYIVFTWNVLVFRINWTSKEAFQIFHRRSVNEDEDQSVTCRSRVVSL